MTCRSCAEDVPRGALACPVCGCGAPGATLGPTPAHERSWGVVGAVARQAGEGEHQRSPARHVRSLSSLAERLGEGQILDRACDEWEPGGRVSTPALQGWLALTRRTADLWYVVVERDEEEWGYRHKGGRYVLLRVRVVTRRYGPYTWSLARERLDDERRRAGVRSARMVEAEDIGRTG